MGIQDLVQVQGDHFLIELPSSEETALAFKHFLEALLCSVDEKRREEISDSVYEAITNSIRHGYHHNDTNLVEIMYWISSDLFKAIITDEGPGFDVQHWKEWYAGIDEREKQWKIGDPWQGYHDYNRRGAGIGLVEIHEHMDIVEFNTAGNQITLVKKLKQ